MARGIHDGVALLLGGEVSATNLHSLTLRALLAFDRGQARDQRGGQHRLADIDDHDPERERRTLGPQRVGATGV